MKWIRKRAGWIAGAAIGGFILWLIGTVVSLQATRVEAAGTLFGKRVPFQTYAQAYQAVLNNALLTYGDKYRQELSNDQIEARVWERLTLLAEARRKKIRVTDRELVEKLQGAPLFQKNGRFDPQGYQWILRTLGISARSFEEQIREDLMMEKLTDQALGDLSISEAELKEGFHQREDTIRVSLVLFPSEPLALEVADAARQEPEELFRAAGQLDLEPVTTDFVKRSDSIEAIGSTASIFGPAFDLEPDQVAGPFSSAKGHGVVKLLEKRPADEEELVKTRESIERSLQLSKRLKRYFSWHNDLLQRAALKKATEEKKPGE